MTARGFVPVILSRSAASRGNCLLEGTRRTRPTLFRAFPGTFEGGFDPRVELALIPAMSVAGPGRNLPGDGYSPFAVQNAGSESSRASLSESPASRLCRPRAV